jgi:hypothetical protein
VKRSDRQTPDEMLAAYASRAAAGAPITIELVDRPGHAIAGVA